MKVLRLMGGLDAVHGGPPVIATNGCIAVQRTGIDTTLAFPVFGSAGDDVNQTIARLRSEGVEVVPVPAAARPGGISQRWGVSAAFTRWIRENRRRYDVVQCDGGWQMATMLNAFGRRGHGPPTVLMPHECLTGFDMAQTRHRAMRFFKRPLRHLLLRRFDLILMSSELEARDSMPPEAASEYVVIPHPVLDDRENMPEPRTAPAMEDGLRLGYIGRLHEKKNVDVLIRALAELDGSVSLTVAGGGPEEKTLRALASELGLNDRIEWAGLVTGGSKEAFFRRIDLLVMPSDYECFGMAGGEALVAGVPAIVSESTGIGEIIRRHGGGEIISPDPATLARTVRDLAGAPDRLATLSREALSAAQAALSFTVCGAALRQAYERLAAHE